MIVEFGKYNNTGIKWEILWVEDGRVLLESKDLDRALEVSEQHYMKPTEENLNCETTWANSDFRKFINHKFFTSAFTQSEQEMILEVHHETPDNPKYGTSGGEATDDRLFLMSLDEYKKHHQVGEALGADEECSDWGMNTVRLRTPGHEPGYTVVIDRVDCDRPKLEGLVNEYTFTENLTVMWVGLRTKP